MERLIHGYRFDDERPIAVGVSSVTYQAVREGAAAVEIPVTIKVIDLNVALDDSGMRPYVEVLDSTPLQHACIVDVRDVIRMGDGKVGIVRELVKGPSVAQLLDTVGDTRLPPQVALFIGKQCAGALAHAHQRGGAHGDFCHRHVLLSMDGQVKVNDFQIAGLLSKARQAESALRVGKRFFLAPERIVGPEKESSPDADVFALGVLIYRMVCGFYPYPDVDGLLDGLTPDLSISSEEWGEPLGRQLGHCLAFEPEARPSAEETWRGLRRILGPVWPGYGAAEMSEFLASVEQRRVSLARRGSAASSRSTQKVAKPPPLTPLPLSPPPPEDEAGGDTVAHDQSDFVGDATQVSRHPSDRGVQLGRVQQPPPLPSAQQEYTKPRPVHEQPTGPMPGTEDRLGHLEQVMADLANRSVLNPADDPLIGELTDRITNLEEANSFLAREVNRLRDRVDILMNGLYKIMSQDGEP